jgi:hypothetical protein
MDTLLGWPSIRLEKLLRHGTVRPSAGFPRLRAGSGLIDVKAAAGRCGKQCSMPFYKFKICDPVNPVEGHRQEGAALADDIDAMLFAAGIVQRLVQEYPSVPRSWAIAITDESREVNVLTFEAGCKVLVRPHWAGEQPRAPEGRR